MNAARRAFEASDYETAVSRAYYAAYHSIISVVESREGARRAWSHRLPEMAARHSDLALFHDDLVDLYEARIVADYGSGVLAESLLEASLSVAERILERSRGIVENVQG